ncbi:MAG: hypothetical protein MUC65_08395, partial [Pontiellaceae bacterium]|nr:hypothetical protein [Pontiellaceae bacterium]
MYVGQTTAGNSLTVEQGGSVTSSYGVIGYNSGASGNSVVIQGTNSSWVNSDGIAVGFYGSDNTLSVLDQASVTIGNLSLGESSGATNNTFEVNNATATINANLQMGGSASRILLGNGGRVITSDNLIFRTDSNTVTISGTGSVLTNSNDRWFYFGEDGGSAVSGNQLLISDGGTLAGFGGVSVGRSAGCVSNLFRISGATTVVQLDFVSIPGLSNRVEVTDGAQLSADYGIDFYQSIDGVLSVSGTGSVCSADILSLYE